MRRTRPPIDRAAITRAGAPTLHAILKADRNPMPFRRAVSIALDVAEDLADAEAQGAAKGALTPDAVLVDEDRAVVVFDPALPQGSLAPIWCPPAQVDGAPFDHAANRFVLGLLLYKMLSGVHPFAGGGLRRALEAARSEAPPFTREVAEALPPGLQALTLRALHPDPEKRPTSAVAFVDALAALHAGGPGAAAMALGAPVVAPVAGAPRHRPAKTLPASPIDPPEHTTLPSAGVARERSKERAAEPAALAAPIRAFGGRPAASVPWTKILLPVAAGAAVAAVAMSTLEAPKKAPKPDVKVGSVSPMGNDDLDAADCASCHSRQVSEWRRSVMGHSVKSPLFNALESLIEEQVGRDFSCPNGAGALRKTTRDLACTNPQTGFAISGSGGEHWCVNCHSPMEAQTAVIPPWAGKGGGDPRALFPVRDLIDDRTLEGIGCSFCHQVHGPVSGGSRGGYQGNPTWSSFVTGRVFDARPEDRLGLLGISNSGYDLQPSSFLLGRSEAPRGPGGAPLPHKRPDESMRRYLASSEFCGSCHDVRLFGSDAIGAPQKGEHFKRLRNAYTEWRDWAALERRKGREAATCQDCHMSSFPGVCVADGGDDAKASDLCPEGTRFSPRAPGQYPDGRVASSSERSTRVTTHYLSGVDLPLSREYPKDLLDETSLDISGIPISAQARRNALLRAAFELGIGEVRLSGSRLTVPVELENVGAGHKVPAGFSQEREIWVHLTVRDKSGRLVYEVGRVDRRDEDLRDKIFDRINTDPNVLDAQGRPQGLFGADVRDGPDKGEWSPPPEAGGTRFIGKGLINFQNGFLRCVQCISQIDGNGNCLPLGIPNEHRGDRFADGNYDIDEGTCTSNLSGTRALFETYFPVGSLDASRGAPKAPDAIIDTRSMPPEVPITYTYDLDVGGARGPFTVRARLLFRAFPPYLVRAFADYERAMDRLGRRPSGPLVDDSMFDRIEIVEVATAERSSSGR